MKRCVQLIAAGCGVCALVVLVIFLMTRTNTNLTTSSNPMVRSLQDAVTAAKVGDRQALSSVLRSLDGQVSLPEELLPVFTSFVGDKDAQVEALGARGLFLLSKPESKKPLIKLLKSVDLSLFNRQPQNDEERQKRDWQQMAILYAAGTLGNIGDQSAIAVLERVKNVPRAEHWDAVAEALTKLRAVSGTDSEKVRDLIATARNEKAREGVHFGAIQALGEIATPAVARRPIPHFDIDRAFLSDATALRCYAFCRQDARSKCRETTSGFGERSQCRNA